MSAWTCRLSNGKADPKIVPPRPRIPCWKGLGADSEEKHEPVSDIDTAVVDSLKALDLKRPIREADIASLVPGKLPRSLPVEVGISKPPWICLWRRCWREQAAPTGANSVFATAVRNEHSNGAILSRRDEQLAVAGLADEEIGAGDLGAHFPID